MFFNAKLTCPACGCQRPFQSFGIQQDILDLAKIASKFGKQWVWVSEYLCSFQSEVDKPLKPKRIVILSEELLEMIDKRGFNLDHKWHVIRPDALFAAIRQTALLNKRGFKSHRYMMKISIDLNLRLIQAEEKDQAERAQEAMSRGRDPGGPQRIKELIKGIGG